MLRHLPPDTAIVFKRTASVHPPASLRRLHEVFTAARQIAISNHGRQYSMRTGFFGHYSQDII